MLTRAAVFAAALAAVANAQSNCSPMQLGKVAMCWQTYSSCVTGDPTNPCPCISPAKTCLNAVGCDVSKWMDTLNTVSGLYHCGADEAPKEAEPVAEPEGACSVGQTIQISQAMAAYGACVQANPTSPCSCISTAISTISAIPCDTTQYTNVLKQAQSVYHCSSEVAEPAGTCSVSQQIQIGQAMATYGQCVEMNPTNPCSCISTAISTITAIPCDTTQYTNVLKQAQSLYHCSSAAAARALRG